MTGENVWLSKLLGYEGTATGDGGASGETIVDSSLTTKPDYNGQMVKIMGGALYGQTRQINGVTTGGTITVDKNFGAQITTGTQYLILPSKVSTVPAKNSTGNNLTSEVIGIKTDDPTLVVTDVSSLVAYAKGILTLVIGIAGSAYWAPFGPANVYIGNATTHGLTLFDPGGGIIPLADITEGTYTIDRVRAAVLTPIVVATPSSKVNGAVYENYAWPGASWAIGDLFIITFTGVKITIGTTTTDLPPVQIWGRIVMEPDILTSIQGKPNVETIEIYPVDDAASLVNPVLNGDGTNPIYCPDPADTTDINDPLAPGVAWTRIYDFEQEGSSVIPISWFAHFEWQTNVVVGAGDATNSLSKIQMSIDGGTTWIDLTDLFTNPVVGPAMTPRTREGERAFAAGITIGVNQLQFRLIHYTDDSVGGPGRSTSSAQIRENCLMRFTYRKS